MNAAHRPAGLSCRRPSLAPRFETGRSRHSTTLVIAASLLLVVGCGTSNENLGLVTGTITLDGQPLSGADVVFTPVGEGGSALAQTREDGSYELYYTSTERGAWIGKNSVTINKEATDEEKEQTHEAVPPRYNELTELTADVQAGANTFDFALERGDYAPSSEQVAY